jgi:hypothetical protein
MIFEFGGRSTPSNETPDLASCGMHSLRGRSSRRRAGILRPRRARVSTHAPATSTLRLRRSGSNDFGVHSRVVERWHLRRPQSPSRIRRCSMVCDPPVQAKKMLGLQSWGQVLGTGCGEIVSRSYRLMPTKKAICWPFRKPSDGLEPSTPSLPWRIRRREGDVGTALVCRISLLLQYFRCQAHPSSISPDAP